MLHTSVILAGLSLLPPVAFALTDSPLAYLNEIRAAAGLASLNRQPELAMAAQGHAEYLALHTSAERRGAGSNHVQTLGADGFVGANPADRALAAGYPHHHVKENLSIGYPDHQAAIDGLMGAIYHRLVFLDPMLSEIGAGAQDQAHVYLLGRTDLRQLCLQPPRRAIARQPFDCGGIRVASDYVDALCDAPPNDALYQPPFHPLCPDGNRLNADYMANFCADPPVQALALASGAYYELCEQRHQVAKEWFDDVCANPPPKAAYGHDGRAVQLCDAQITLHADWFEDYCHAVPDEQRFTESGYYTEMCAKPRKINREYREELDQRRHADAPMLVIWPPEDAREVPPAFFEEQPDPLPDREVSGYPISLQFNPLEVSQPRVIDFRLQRADGPDWTRVESIRRLDATTDPNGLLSTHQFAFFPLHRLGWNTEYRVSVAFQLDQERLDFDWTFRTKDPASPILTMEGKQQTLALERNQTYVLYIPPTDTEGATVLKRETRVRQGNRLDVRVIDPNTLAVKIDGPWCSPSQLTLQSARKLRLKPADCPD